MTIARSVRCPWRAGARLLAAASAVVPAAIPAVGAATGTCLQLDARFVEGAPRDRFVFHNRSQPAGQVVGLELSLRGSRGNLIFDTQDGGSGVEVFQPFRAEASEADVADVQIPDDGTDSVAVTFERFAPGDSFTFSIDVDDQLADSELGQIRVSGSEIQGAGLLVSFRAADGAEHRLQGAFGPDAAASLGTAAGCSTG